MRKPLAGLVLFSLTQAAAAAPRLDSVSVQVLAGKGTDVVISVSIERPTLLDLSCNALIDAGDGGRIPISDYRWVFPTLAAGLAVNIVTGILLFIKNPVMWGTAVPFLIKMALVIASVATVLPMRSFVRRRRS